MREKYILEEYDWFDNAGTLYLRFNTNREKALEGISPENRKLIVEAHQECLDKLVAVALAFAEFDNNEFSKVWYGEEPVSDPGFTESPNVYN